MTSWYENKKSKASGSYKHLFGFSYFLTLEFFLQSSNFGFCGKHTETLSRLSRTLHNSRSELNTVNMLK